MSTRPRDHHCPVPCDCPTCERSKGWYLLLGLLVGMAATGLLWWLSDKAPGAML